MTKSRHAHVYCSGAHVCAHTVGQRRSFQSIVQGSPAVRKQRYRHSTYVQTSARVFSFAVTAVARGEDPRPWWLSSDE